MAFIKYENELNAREATLRENGSDFHDKELEVEHRLIVASFEADDSVAKPDPRVPSAAPPSETSESTSSTYKPHYNPYNVFKNRNSAPHAVLSNAPHPRSFSANQFYSPNPGQYSAPFLHSGSYEGMPFFNPMMGSPPSSATPRYSPQAFPGMHFGAGYFPQGSVTNPPLVSGKASTPDGPGANNSNGNGVGISSGAAVPGAGANGASGVGKDGMPPFYYDNDYFRYYARHGNSMAMMNPMMLAAAYSQAGYNPYTIAAAMAASQQPPLGPASAQSAPLATPQFGEGYGEYSARK